jgi:hypothetical protein
MAEPTQRTERALYPGVKKALTAYLRQEDDQITMILEITADKFPEKMKPLIPDNVLFLLDSKETRPDLFGEIGPDCTAVYGQSKFLLTAEVKDGSPTINDVFQAKKYGELYSAQAALLISTEQPEERLRRMLIQRPSLLAYAGATWSLYLCRYSEQNETIDWWFEKKEPRLK